MAMAMPSAVEPFAFHTERRLVVLTGLQASNLEELLTHLRQVSGSCVFYHTHVAYLTQHFEKPKRDRTAMDLALSYRRVRAPVGRLGILAALRGTILCSPLLHARLRPAAAYRPIPGGAIHRSVDRQKQAFGAELCCRRSGKVQDRSRPADADTSIAV